MSSWLVGAEELGRPCRVEPEHVCYNGVAQGKSTPPRFGRLQIQRFSGCYSTDATFERSPAHPTPSHLAQPAASRVTFSVMCTTLSVLTDASKGAMLLGMCATKFPLNGGCGPRAPSPACGNIFGAPYRVLRAVPSRGGPRSVDGALAEPFFHRHSFGLRRGASANRAIAHVHEDIEPGRDRAVVVEVDIERFLNAMNHDRPLEVLAKKVPDPFFPRHVQRLLRGRAARRWHAHGDNHGDTARSAAGSSKPSRRGWTSSNLPSRRQLRGGAAHWTPCALPPAPGFSILTLLL
jgi:hypothetical protein